MSRSDRKRLQRLRRRLFADLQPEGELESLWVNELALTTFRRARIPRWESALITEKVREAREELVEDDCDDDDVFDDENDDDISDHENDDDENDDDVSEDKSPPKLTKAEIAAVSMLDEAEIGLLTRYERALDRKTERILAQLRRSQMQRKAGTAKDLREQ